MLLSASVIALGSTAAYAQDTAAPAEEQQVAANEAAAAQPARYRS